MTTGADIHNDIPLPNRTEALTLRAINAALAASYRYGFVLEKKAAAAITFASGTFSYSLAAITDLLPDLGAGELWVNANGTAESAFLLREWRQEYSHTTGIWTVYVPSGIASAYTAKTVDVRYNYRPPRITALTDTLTTPEEYIRYYVMAWYAEMKLAESDTANRPTWAQNHRDWMALALKAILSAPRHILSTERIIPDRLG